MTLSIEQNRELLAKAVLLQSKHRNGRKFNGTIVPIMSLGAAKEDFWQSTARSTIRQRCKSIFNEELLSDVKFIIRDSQGGSESKAILAHKFVLAISSPVFFAMFYGEMAEKNDSVEIFDCEYESLLELLRFIYSDEANLNPDNVMQLMYLAKKYILPSLVDRCSAYVQQNLNASNVFHVLPAVQKFEEKDLLSHCWKVIEKETEEAVKSDAFVAIERSVLEELVVKDSLNIGEVELFKAVDCWAENKCEKQGLAVEGPVKRRILGERIVKGIRFPVMEQKGFASVVLDSGILTHKECFDMVKYFNSVLDTPLGFSEEKRPGYVKTVSRFRLLNTGCNDSSMFADVIGVTVDKNIKLHGVRCFGSDSNEYSVSLNVYSRKDVPSERVASETGNFLSKRVRSEMGDYQGFDISFKAPVTMQANTLYEIGANITGPPSWCGKDGLKSVECSGVKFVFSNFGGTKTCVKSGQFPEFVFSVDEAIASG